jgi:hypothetical protein
MAMSTPWMTVVEPKALRTSRIATEAIHPSLPATRNNRFVGFFACHASERSHQRLQIMVPARCRKQA